MGIWDPDIYAITDDEGRVKYVGRTTQRVRYRLSAHHSAKTPCGEWLRANRERARIKILEADVPYAKAGLAERRWIMKFREEGHDLLNHWPQPRLLEAAYSALDKEEEKQARPTSNRNASSTPWWRH